MSEIKRTYPQVKIKVSSKKLTTAYNTLVTDLRFTNYPGEGATGFNNDPRTKVRNNWEKFLKHVYNKYVSKYFTDLYVSYDFMSIVDQEK